jgi:hypothetical protein
MSRPRGGLGVFVVAALSCVYLIAGIGTAFAAMEADRQRDFDFTGKFLIDAARNAATRLSATNAVNEARQTASAPVMPTIMPIVAPLFIEDDQFTSTLVLVNASALNTYADVTFAGLDGGKIATKRVQFTPHSQQSIEVGAALAASASTATSGSISVMQSSQLEGMSILAQLSMTYRGSSQPNYIDEELAMPSMSGSSVLRGVAERSEGSPLVALTSLVDVPQQVTIQCLGKDGIFKSKSVVVLADETVVTQACSQGTNYGADLETAMLANDAEKQDSVGIQLTSSAMPGSLAAFGLAPHGGSEDRYFSNIGFADPKMAVSANTTFTGVPVGDSQLLPGGKYVPEVALANFSAKAVHAHVKYSTTGGTSPTILDAKSLTVPAQSTRWLRLDNVQSADGLQNSFIVESDGAAGDLGAKLVSRSDSELREVEVPGKDELNVNNGGAHPWTLKDGAESTLLLFNHGTNPDTFNVAISTGSLTWQKTYLLAPMQTLALNFRDLIQNQSKDDKGRTLPKDAVSGMVNWFPPDASNSSGRILVSNKALAMARNFSCDLGDFLCAASFDPSITTFLNGEIVDFGELIGVVCSGIPCKGTQVGSGTFSYTWSSGNTDVISLSGSTTQSSISTLGVAGGSTSVNGTVYTHYDVGGENYNCTFPGGGSGKVQVPTSLEPTSFPVVSNTYLGNGTCGDSSYGIAIAIHYQVLDQNGGSINSSAMEPQEMDPALGFPNWGQIGPTSYPGTSQFTDSTGKFYDAPLGECAGQAFSRSDTQYLSILVNGKRYPVTGAMRTNNWTTSSSQAGHGSITNGADISNSR